MRSWELTEDLERLRLAVRRFVDDEVIPVEREAIDDETVMLALTASAKEQGLWALGHPAEIGGAGLAFLDYVHVSEIIGRSPAASVALGAHTHQDALMLHRFGTQQQKDRWLKPLVDGDAHTAVALTEPEVAGSDPKMMRTTARLVGDEWVLDGHKWFVSWADRASFLTVFAKTDPNAELHRQYSAILVPTDTAGYSLERRIPIMGDSASPYGEIRLNEARVPTDHLLGERGEGFSIAQQRLGPARILDGIQWVGRAQRAFELMCSRANSRYAHGSLLSEKGEIQRYVAESAAEIQAARLMALDAARVLAQGADARVQISLLKFYAARMLHDVVDRSIQVHGAAGVSADLPLERMYRDARQARLYDGPDEVHRMVVARELLDDLEANAPWR